MVVGGGTLGQSAAFTNERVVVFLFVTATMYVVCTAFALTSQKWYGCVLRGRRLGLSINRRPPFGINDGASAYTHSGEEGGRSWAGSLSFSLNIHPLAFRFHTPVPVIPFCIDTTPEIYF